MQPEETRRRPAQVHTAAFAPQPGLGQHGPERGDARQVFKLNRIIGFVMLVAVVYGVLQTYGLLPRGAPQLFPHRSGSPAA